MLRSLIIAVCCCTVIQYKSFAQEPTLAEGSKIAYKASIDSLKVTSDPLKKEEILMRLEKANPSDDFSQYKYAMVYYFAVAKNVSKTLYYFKQLKGTSREAGLAVIPLLLMKVDAKIGETFVKEELAKSINTVQERRVLLDVQRIMMVKKGDYKKAFAAMKEYYEGTTTKSPSLTARYYYLMSKSGGYKEALPGLEKAVAEGTASEDLKAELKAAYGKLNPGKNPATYLAALVKPVEDQYRAKFVAKMFSRPAPNFTVTDINDKVVALSDFKGKVVVLDFWATWCGPCKRGLPAMQMTVDKYKADPNVVFLFIHTWEKVSNPKEDALAYLTDSDLRLPLYMDIRPAGKVNQAVAAFGIMAIPAKFIIDAQGNIRFTATGFSGTDENAVNEISTMIELARVEAKIP